MNELNGEKKNLKKNLYKLYRQVASYADFFRALLSLGEERVTKLLKTSPWEANEYEKPESQLSFWGSRESRENNTQKERRARGVGHSLTRSLTARAQATAGMIC